MRRIIKKNLLVFFVFIPFTFSFAQPDSSLINSEEKIEDFLEESPDEENNSDLYEIIEYLALNPVNINSAGIKEFIQIPFMNISQAEIIINHRKTYGNFFSVNELYSIRNINKDFIDQIIPFVVVQSNKPQNKEENLNFFNTFLDNSDFHFRSRSLDDLQERKGFAETKYLGTKSKIYNRFLLKNPNLQAGFTLEKDPGEKYINDFSSFHFSLKDYSFINNFTAGDYLFEFGQGLVLWSPYGFSKGSDAVFPLRKREKGIRPYTSTDENNFFRGAAASFNIFDLNLSIFYSNKKSDANIDALSGLISSTPIDGYHRTESEIARNKTLKESVGGGRIDYSFGSLSSGFLFYNSNFNNNFEPSSFYDLQGNNFSFYSFYYDFIYKSMNFFGETAYDGAALATINNFIFSVNKNFSFVTSVRNYPENFTDLHGFGFGERGGAVQNEFGIYTGIKWKMFLGELNFYYDRYKFSYSTFNNPLPASGEDILVNLFSKPFKGTETNIKLKYEVKDEAINFDEFKLIFKGKKFRGKAEVIHSVSKNFRLKTRFEYVNYNVREISINENGFLLYQDLRIIPEKNLSFFSRIIFFRTDSFNSAVYQYENDLTGISASTALFGEGLRWYIMIKYKMWNYINFSLKYSETYKPEEKFLSSGNNEIKGNIDNKISLQVDVNI